MNKKIQLIADIALLMGQYKMNLFLSGIKIENQRELTDFLLLNIELTKVIKSKLLILGINIDYELQNMSQIDDLLLRLKITYPDIESIIELGQFYILIVDKDADPRCFNEQVKTIFHAKLSKFLSDLVIESFILKIEQSKDKETMLDIYHEIVEMFIKQKNQAIDRSKDSELKKKFQNLLAKGKLELVLTELLDFFKKQDNKLCLNEIIMYNAQFSQLEKQSNIISFEEWNRANSKITISVIDFIDKNL